jgi:hypothetical protein
VILSGASQPRPCLLHSLMAGLGLAAESPDSDRAARPLFSERASEVRMDQQRVVAPLCAEAATIVQVMVAKYEVTRNPLFLWEALQVLTAPGLEGAALVLPSALRLYLQEASDRVIVAALSRPKEFGGSVLTALGFSEGRGASPAKDYARDQSIGILLSIYDEMKRRFDAEKNKAARAEQFMADALGIDAKSMRGRLTAARKTEARMHQHLGWPAPSEVPRGMYWTDVPEEILAERLRGMPDVVWQEGGVRLGKSKTPRR